MKLQWLGTAGLAVEANDQSFLIDPYLSSNSQALSAQNLRPENIAKAGQIFITHGHFDHLYDVPEIMSQGTASVYCSEIAASSLVNKGVNSDRITVIKADGFSADCGGYRAQAFFSRHIKFDIPLIAKALLRVGTKYSRLAKIIKGYPQGQVLSWRFTINGYTMHHFGSGGSTPDELSRLAVYPLDLLLVPLQGHTHICDIAWEYVRVLKPRLVIPIHHDNFYPPVSEAIDISPFVQKVRKNCPGTEVRIMSVNEIITL
jgi:L-ascorbate metabolism protein UlaG (beta-lactamase superfamily)